MIPFSKEVLDVLSKQHGYHRALYAWRHVKYRMEYQFHAGKSTSLQFAIQDHQVKLAKPANPV